MTETLSTTITCDFTAPEVSLGAFKHQETGEALDALLECESVQLLHKMQPDDTIESSALAELEQTALYDGIEAVRSCVKYQAGKKPWQEQNRGDCFTFTWLVSDVAAQLGFDSRIAFCNGHAFNLIATPAGGFHMISGETKPMWLFDVLDNAYSRDALPDLSNVFAAPTGEPHYYSMYTTGLKAYSERIQTRYQRFQLPWVDDSLPAAAVMDPETGKQALFTYTCLQDALQSRSCDVRTVATTLAALDGVNPQAETRERINDDLKCFKRHVRSWSMDDSVDVAAIMDCVELYTAIMPDTKSMNIFTADCYRIIGDKRNDLIALEQAEALYVYAAQRTNKTGDMTLLGKMQANTRLMDRVANT